MVHNTNGAYNLRFHVSSILILSKRDVYHKLIVVQYVITSVWASWNFFRIIVSSGSSMKQMTQRGSKEYF
jgi:hypothetical protein